MNFKEIKELIEILDKSTLTEINIEDTKGKVTLKKEKETEIITPQISQMPVEAAAMPMPQVQSTDSNKTEAPKPTSDNHKTINAPMVGTGEIVEILVEDGQMVEYGQPLFKVK